MIRLAALMAASMLASPAMAASPVAKAFGMREGVQQISLSPDGTHAAIIVPSGTRGTALVVADFMTGDTPKPILAANGKPDRLTYCRWSTNTQIVCQILTMVESMEGYTPNTQFSRLITISSDGKAMKSLSARASFDAMSLAQRGGSVIDWLAQGGDGSVLMDREFVPEQSSGSLIDKSKQGLGVERVDTVTLVRHTVGNPRATASEYIGYRPRNAAR